MRKFNLQIVTPDGEIFSGDAEGILVRTDGGDVEIMAGHSDYFATLSTGRAKLTVDGKAREAAASGGFISVKGSDVKLVATTFEFAENIDVKRARAAKERTEQLLLSAKDDRDIKHLKAKLLRALSRLSVATGEGL